MAKRFDRIGWAMAQPNLSAPQKSVLIVLADAASEKDGSCWLSHATLAERTSLGVTTVRDALRVLCDGGLLGVKARFMDNGKQTSNEYILGCYISDDGDWIDLEELMRLFEQARITRVSAPDTQPGADTSPVGSRHHVEPPTRTTTRKNNSSTTSKSRSSRPAKRARDDAEWTDPARAVFDPPEQDDEPDTKPRGGPDSAWGLNGYYRDAVKTAGNGFLGNTNDGAMRKFFAQAKRQGVKPNVLREMVDAFVEDERLFTRATAARWRVFIANAETLRQRAAVKNGVGPQKLKSYDEVPQFGGSIPQHILDEILAEAG